MMRSLASWLAVWALAVGCSDNGGGGGDGTSSDGVSLSAADVHQVAAVNGTPPGSGHYFVVLDATVTDAGSNAAPLSPVQFSLETSAGVAFTASPLTAEESNACDASASVEPGASATCTAVFEVSSTSITELIYTLTDGRTATTPVSLGGSGSGGSGGGGSLGDACDTTHGCSDGLSCAGSAEYGGGSAIESTCESTCANDTACEDLYGTALCTATETGSSSGVCVVPCGSDGACPGVLTCYGSAFCAPPGAF